MDEAGVAEHFKLIEARDVLDIIDIKPEALELVITGRGVSEAVMARADLITEMRPIKHYYEDGVLARVGIES